MSLPFVESRISSRGLPATSDNPQTDTLTGTFHLFDGQGVQQRCSQTSYAYGGSECEIAGMRYSELEEKRLISDGEF